MKRNSMPAGPWLSAFVILMSLCSGDALGDGGTVQATETKDGLTITGMSDPTPPRVGTVDVSVLVQDAENNTPIDVDHVSVSAAWRQPNDIVRTMSPATREKAQNKLYYAAEMRLDRQGTWDGEATVIRDGKTTTVPFSLDVQAKAEPASEYWLWLYLPLLPIALIGSRMLRKRSLSRRFDPMANEETWKKKRK